jgi:outer membrane protein insertion porin family
VRSIKFRFTGPHELHPDELSAQMVTRAPGAFHGLHAAVARIPFVPDPGRHPFDPVRLQEDVARLRRYYRRQGFLDARVDYEATADQDRRRVRVTILVEEGPYLRLRDLLLLAPDGSSEIGAPELQEEIQDSWQEVRERRIGTRFSDGAVREMRTGLETYLGDRGYTRPKIEPRSAVDSTAHDVDLVWLVDPGARARLSEIHVEGVTKVPERIVTRQLGIETGDWISRKALVRGRENVVSVDLFRTANLDLAEGAPGDTALALRVMVKEDGPRFTQIEAGYATDGAGLSGQVRWTHPNFTGGARSLNAVALVQSGVWATSEVKDRLLRGTLLLNQPYVGVPALSMAFGPSFEARDGHIDRSVAWSLQNTLVYRFTTLQSAALRYEYTYRRVDESHIRDLVRNSALAESLAVPVRSSLLTLNTSLGQLDDFGRPRRGVVVKPNLSITTPSAWGSVEFGRADVQVTAFAPLPGGSNAVMLRGKVGQLWPFGKSIPPPGENPAVELLRLRDFSLTAGGADDVRGYGTRMLGPKLPGIDQTISGTDTVLTSDHYVDAGGLRRWTGSVELRLGMRSISKDVFAHVFLDAGQVWTSDSRFEFPEIESSDEIAHYGTGAGLGYYTAVGAIRFDVGYKLNPSVFDLRDPQDVLDAALAGRNPATAPEHSMRRYALHLSLGLYF